MVQLDVQSPGDEVCSPMSETEASKSLETSAIEGLVKSLDGTRREIQDHREILKDTLGALIAACNSQAGSSQQSGIDQALNEQLIEATQRLSWHLEKNAEDLQSMMENVNSGWSLKTDSETGLSNRRGFEDTLTLMLGLKERYGVDCSVVVLGFGHGKDQDSRDALNSEQVCQIAERIQTSIRDTDIVARYGRNEFITLLPVTDRTGAMVLAARLCEELGQEIDTSFYAGVTNARAADGTRGATKRADSALYAAVTNGPGSVCVHNGRQIELVDPAILAAI